MESCEGPENFLDFDELITNLAPNLWFAPLVSEAADCAMIFGLVAELRTYPANKDDLHRLLRGRMRSGQS